MFAQEFYLVVMLKTGATARYKNKQNAIDAVKKHSESSGWDVKFSTSEFDEKSTIASYCEINIALIKLINADDFNTKEIF